jgi:peptidoglycan/LPS O-acetylase OafA/YrhL
VCVPALLVFAGVLKIAGASLVMFPAMILLFQLIVPSHSARLNGVLGTVGDLTYASYMLHFPLQLAVVLTFETLGFPLASVFARPGFFLAYIALVFGVAFAVFRWFERPAQNALRSLGRRGERGSVVAAR